MIVKTPDEIRREFAVLGLAISDWARQMGYPPALVHQVLGGRLRCVRGKSHEIAVRLGLKDGRIRKQNELPFSSQEQDTEGPE